MRYPRQLHQNLLLHLLNSWWLQFARSARDQSNRWIITFTASPAWAWPTPRRRWTSPTADIARTYRSFPFPRTVSAPLSNIEGFLSFGHEEGDDAMFISASEKEDWAGSEPDQLNSSEPSDLQEELMRVLSKAVQELELTWSPPE